MGAADSIVDEHGDRDQESEHDERVEGLTEPLQRQQGGDDPNHHEGSSRLMKMPTLSC